MRLQTLKNCITGLISLLICQIIFFTMNEIIAGLLMLFGLSIVGLCIFRLIKFTTNKLAIEKMKDIINKIKENK